MASPLLVGGIFTNGLSSAVAVLVGFTGLVGGVGRYGGILLARTPGEMTGLPRWVSFAVSGLEVLPF